MRCKVRKIPLFRGKYGYKKETVTDTFVSITVSVMVAEAGLEPTTSGLWAAVYITFSANNRHFGAFLGSLLPPAIRWNLPRPLRDNPVWVKTWVKNVALLWVSQTGSFLRHIWTYDTLKTTLSSLFRGLRWPCFQEVFHALFSSHLPIPAGFLPLPVFSCPGSNMGQKHGSGCFPSPQGVVIVP